MKTYKVKWNYRSSMGGPFLEGDKVELDEVIASAINRDSPGVLTIASNKAETKEKPAALAGAQDRMVKAAKARTEETPKVGVPERGVEEPITKETFKAVKG